jgi:hypothetical protein
MRWRRAQIGPTHPFGSLEAPAGIEAGGLRETEGRFGWQWSARGPKKYGTQIDPRPPETRDKSLARCAEKGTQTPCAVESARSSV